MKKAELTFAVISVPVDYVMLVLAGITAYSIRYADWVQSIRPVVFDLSASRYNEVVLSMAAVWLIIFALQGLYTISFHKRLIDELSQIVFACSTGLMLIIVYIFWQREFFDSRFIILAAWIFSILYVGTARMLLRFIRRVLLAHDWGITRAVLIGTDRAADDLAATFYRQPSLGYRIVERYQDFSEDRFKQLLTETGIDCVILADSGVDKETRSRILSFCDSSHVAFQYVADMFEAQAHNVDIKSMAGMPVIEIKKTPLDGWQRIYKRLFDVIIGTFLFLIFIPIGLVIALIIKLDSAGPVIATLQRVGKEGRTFSLYKFRSMIKDAHLLKYDDRGNLRPELAKLNQRADGPLFKNEHDARITRFGRWLRRTSLDEVPQLLNVIRGDMSLVGPRPHEPEEVQRYEEYQKKLLSIKPGMTGLAQVSGRANLSFGEEVKLDLYYIENWSLKNDVQIIFKTFWVVIRKQGVA